MSDLNNLTEMVKKGKRKEAVEIVEASLAEKTAPRDILNAMLAAMDDIGARFKKNEIYVPEVLIAARAMKEAMAVLEPELVAAGIKPEHKIVVGTVKGDLHDIGKNLVAMMLRGANFEVIDVGVNVTPESFIEAVKQHDADVVAMSALLTTTMPAMKEGIDAIKAAGLADVKVMIGGAPITQDYADQIGADGYSADAASAVDLAKKLVA